MGLKELVRKHIDQYVEQLDGEIPQDLYDLVISQVEHALLTGEHPELVLGTNQGLGHRTVSARGDGNTQL